MRCTNCGWDNANQNTRCEKCNAPLEKTMGVGGEDQVYIYETPPSGMQGPIGKTVREDQGYNKTQRDYPKTQRDPIEDHVAPLAPQEPKQPSNAEPVYGGTIPPWMQFGTSAMSFCRLTPMPLAPNEKHLPQEVELKGEYNELNRGNLDPDNFTISQKIQAVLTCKDGKWFIKDQSPYKTTYILVSEEVPLKNGDVILMGNRRFVFTEE